MIPIADDVAVPPDPSVNIPTLPEIKTLGTVSDLDEEMETHTEDKLIGFKNKSNAEMDCCEDRGEGDKCSDRHMITAPKVKYLKGLHIEMFFGYSVDDGIQCLGWYHGTVQALVNEKKNHVIINWDAEFLGEHDVRVTDQKLVLSNWNPKKVKKGGCQEYLTKK